MTSVLSGSAAPGTSIVTTAETVAANIPATQLQPPANATGLIIRGRLNFNPGTATTEVVIKLRAGQNNTTTAQVDTGLTEPVAAGTSAAEFEFQDPAVADIGIGGYTITITQTAATGNGTLLNIEWELDYVVP